MNNRQILDGMKGHTTDKRLPKWMQHAGGAIPHPTPEEVEKDFQREAQAAQDAINGKPDSKATRDMHAALMQHYGEMTLDGRPPAGGGLMSAAATYLSRIDWQQVFVFAARSMAAAAVAYLTFQFARYFQYFGVGALAMSGQFAISLFFLAVILNHTDGLRILTAALGLFLLVNSF